MSRKPINYLEGRKCCKCGNSETRIDSNGRYHWYSDRNKQGFTTGKYLCYYCYNNIGKKGQRISKHKNTICAKCGSDYTSSGWFIYYSINWSWDGKSYICNKCYCGLPDSYGSLIKYMRKSRTGQLSIDDTIGLGLIGETIVAKVRKLEVISIKLDNFNTRFDLSVDPEYDIIQIKTKILIDGEWHVHFRNRYFDNLFILCMSSNTKNIERIYIIPVEDINKKGIADDIHIYKRDTLKAINLWEEFRIDGKSCSLYNDAFQSLMSFLRDKKYFGIEDIKKWMEI